MENINDVPAGNNIPTTLQGSSGNMNPYLFLGKDYYTPDVTHPPENNFWFLIIDLSSLKVVVNELSSSNDSVPASVQEYADKPGFLLIFVFVNVFTFHVPQGELALFLRKTGSGKLLSSVEQICEQTGSNVIAFPSYGLVATLDQGDLPGFEALDFYHPVLLPFTFKPIKIDDKTTYIAVEIGA